MIIKKVRLHNIRSYVDAEISFIEGKTLIAGDIGAGKSTILLAIEFALFGFIKGDISGSMLLRHGWNEGFVELSFEINGQEIIIHRALKRASTGIVQDAGFIVKNNRKEDATATELKAQILALIGYPEDLMTKSKSLIYRYTVYTPQEEMKSILFGDADERLNIIRRIFGIDKYRIIKENSDVYTRHLREQLKEMAGMTFDLEAKKSRLKVIDAELIAAQNDVLSVEPLVLKAKNAVEQCRSKLVEFEQKKLVLSDVKKQRDICNASLQQFANEKFRLENEQKKITEQIAALKVGLGSVVVEESFKLKELIAQKNAELLSLDAEHLSVLSKTANVVAAQRISNELIKEIELLNNCPLCLQKVSDDHKHSIITDENSKIIAARQAQEQIVCSQNVLNEKISFLKNEIDALRMKERNSELFELKRHHLAEHEKMRVVISARLSEITADTQKLSEKNVLFEKELTGFVSLEQEYLQAKSVFDAALLEERKTEIALGVVKEKVMNAEKNRQLLGREVEEKEIIMNKMIVLKKCHDWVRDGFQPLVEAIEKQVLARVYVQFNELFQQWFGMLIDDEMFSARLDDSFAPVLQQNGFDTVAENLSGGEKTACALAYRLALNKVINDVMTLVQTKDVLILDEPTDGFSDGQLDKVRDVLNFLGLKQVILVSHERKVEGFVDSIIHVQKQAHVTVVGESFI